MKNNSWKDIFFNYWSHSQVDEVNRKSRMRECWYEIKRLEKEKEHHQKLLLEENYCVDFTGKELTEEIKLILEGWIDLIERLIKHELNEITLLLTQEDVDKLREIHLEISHGCIP